MSPNSSISSSNARHFLAGFICAAILLLFTGVGLAIYLEPIQGDLTRIGRLGERFFVPQKIQPAQTRYQNPPSTDADIMVLGDSFSAQNLWQSRVHDNTGMNSISFHYDDIPCIERWFQDAIGGVISRKAKIIIFSTVERLFIPRFGSSMTDCDAKAYEPRKTDKTAYPLPVSKYDVFPVDLSWLLKAVSNQHKLESRQGRMNFDKSTIVNLEKRGLFSNRLRGKLLYYGPDDELRNHEWTPERSAQAVANLQRYQSLANIKGIQLIVFVVPDKSMVYAPWVKPGQIPIPDNYDVFETLENSFGAEANLLPEFRQLAAQQKDFYLPNDTHVSIAGYQFMGDHITALLKKSQTP